MLTFKHMAGHLTKIKRCSVDIEDAVTWHEENPLFLK